MTPRQGSQNNEYKLTCFVAKRPYSSSAVAAIELARKESRSMLFRMVDRFGKSSLSSKAKMEYSYMKNAGPIVFYAHKTLSTTKDAYLYNALVKRTTATAKHLTHLNLFLRR